MKPVLFKRQDGRILADKAYCTQDVSERVVGWFGKKSSEPGEGLLISPCSSIHSFGMRFPFDAVFLDEALRVTRVWRGLKANRLAWAPAKYLIFAWRSQVLELPAGAAAGIEMGEQLGMTDRA